MPRPDIQPEEGDIVLFYCPDSHSKKYAISLEPLRIHQYKTTFNGVLLTSRRVDKIYPHDYLLPGGLMPLLTKVICDQPVLIYKKSVIAYKVEYREAI